MTTMVVSSANIAALKSAIAARFPKCKSSHVSEAIAAALDYATHIGLVDAVRWWGDRQSPFLRHLSPEAFRTRLQELQPKVDVSGVHPLFFEELGLKVWDANGKSGRMDAFLIHTGTGEESKEKDRRKSKKEKAQDLINSAWEVGHAIHYPPEPERQFKLAQQAVELDPDAIDGYVAMAEALANPEDQIPLLEMAVSIGEDIFGEQLKSEPESVNWYELGCRPFIRALNNLGLALREVGRLEEAAKMLARTLKVNPNDNTGARGLLMAIYLDLGKWDKARALSRKLRRKASADGDMIEIMYARALIAFRFEEKDRDCLLATAIDSNPFVPGLISSNREWIDSWSIACGSEEEALSYLTDGRRHWRSVTGAVEWLKNAPAPEKGSIGWSYLQRHRDPEGWRNGRYRPDQAIMMRRAG